MNRTIRSLFLLMLAAVLLSGCAEPEEGRFAPPQLLSSEEGEYSILLIVDETVSTEERSEIIDQVVSTATVRGILDEATIAKPSEYESLAIEETPAVLIMDTEEIVLQTTDMEEAEAFLADQ
ncbi:hypothetical protein [Indiicoccus explosivorum]|uniref:hypothetical protein n=1 Tax=Indiicoccus explosivorum TaxID=1917864 RepID=UPI000B43D169|nr:hypothetical protein [Indiicoccus explosivorum]